MSPPAALVAVSSKFLVLDVDLLLLHYGIVTTRALQAAERLGDELAEDGGHCLCARSLDWAEAGVGIRVLGRGHRWLGIRAHAGAGRVDWAGGAKRR